MEETAERAGGRRYPPFAVPAESPGMPSIGSFLDELPSIADFLASDAALLDAVRDAGEDLPAIDKFAPDEFDADGWAIADWQAFDWDGIRSLARRNQNSTAQASWTATEWAPEDEGAYGVTEDDFEFGPEESSPDEVAAALNDIADRIRSGELAIDMFHGKPPEAAIAAALAALLRMRG